MAVLTAPGDIRSLLAGTRTIAGGTHPPAYAGGWVGRSSDPSRDSHHVASYLADRSYRVIGVNPHYASGDGRRSGQGGRSGGGVDAPAAGPEFRGERVYPSLAAIPPEDLERIDFVDVFRRPEEAAAVANESARLGIPAIWFQLGVDTPEAVAEADRAGMAVVAGICIMTAHRLLRPAGPSAASGPGGG